VRLLSINHRDYCNCFLITIAGNRNFDEDRFVREYKKTAIVCINQLIKRNNKRLTITKGGYHRHDRDDKSLLFRVSREITQILK